MKKFLLSIFALCVVLMSASAAKIYVNPGHGSWNTANCRNMRTINYQQYGDTWSSDVCSSDLMVIPSVSGSQIPICGSATRSKRNSLQQVIQ